jgi:hypothetical protein
MTNMLVPQHDQPFICPECGSRRSSGHFYHKPKETLRSGLPKSPWDAVLQSFNCADCFNRIPGHLAMRWQGRSLVDAQKQWARVFRPLRDQDEVNLITKLAAGWDIVAEGNQNLELWDRQYGVCASISDLMEEINCEVAEGIDWSFLASLDGINRHDALLDKELTSLEELLSYIEGVALHEHDWMDGNRSGVYVHLLVKKVDRYRVVKALNLIASELTEQLEAARTSN